MQFQKPTSWAAAALLILLLGTIASLSLVGWEASSFNSANVGLAGAFAMIAGVVAAVVLCVGLLTVVFHDKRSARSKGDPVTMPTPPTVPTTQRHREASLWD